MSKESECTSGRGHDCRSHEHGHGHRSCGCGHDHGDERIGPTIALIMISVILLAVDYLRILPFEGLSWIVVAICGIPIMYNSVKDTVLKRDINTETLVTIGILAACAINEPFAAGEIAVIMTIGEMIEGHVTSKTRDGVTHLMKMNPETANRVDADGETKVNTEDLKVGDIVRIRAGEMIVADGTVVYGNGETDMSMITGESVPVSVSEGDSVLSGSVNVIGSFDFRVDRVPENSTMMNIVEMLRDAESQRTPIMTKMNLVSKIMIVTALSVAAAIALITGNYISAVTVLVVFCPCSLLLATPTAITAAIGTASSNGILIRNGEAVERLSKISMFAFDKTGTVTNGNPIVTKINSYGKMNDGEILEVAAVSEVLSQHPVAESVVSEYVKSGKGTPDEPDSFGMIENIGVRATYGGNEYLVGNRTLMERFGMDVPPAYGSDGTVVYVAVNGNPEGDLVLKDELRTGTVSAIEKLDSMGIGSILISGDRRDVTESVAKAAGIKRFEGDCRPDDKLNILIGLAENEGKKVCMVGDGINDTPAMKAAYASIGMGLRGSDIALESSDAIMMNDEIEYVPDAIELCRRTSRKITVNIILALAINFIALGLAMTAILDPVSGALVHNIGAILVVINSLTLTLFRRKHGSGRNAKETSVVPKDAESF